MLVVSTQGADMSAVELLQCYAPPAHRRNTPRESPRTIARPTPSGLWLGRSIVALTAFAGPAARPRVNRANRTGRIHARASLRTARCSLHVRAAGDRGDGQPDRLEPGL